MNYDLMKFRGTPMFCIAETIGENVFVNLTSNQNEEIVRVGDTIEWRDKNKTTIAKVLEVVEERPAKVSSDYKGEPLTFMRVRTKVVNDRDLNVN